MAGFTLLLSIYLGITRSRTVYTSMNAPEHSTELQLLHPQVSQQRGQTACHLVSWNPAWAGSRSCHCTQTCLGLVAWASLESGSLARPTGTRNSRKSTRRRKTLLGHSADGKSSIWGTNLVAWVLCAAPLFSHSFYSCLFCMCLFVPFYAMHHCLFYGKYISLHIATHLS